MRLVIRCNGIRADKIHGEDVVVETPQGDRLEGVTSVTWHCGGRKERPVCVLVLRDVEVQGLLADVPREMAAALRLLDEVRLTQDKE